MPMFGGWMMLLWLVFLAAVVVGVVFLVRALWRPSPGGQRGANGKDGAALRILEERFARGEIDEREFEQRKRVLRS
ncbi:MAG: SHOCT domain-containing protein [Actinomycetota bacterium]